MRLKRAQPCALQHSTKHRYKHARCQREEAHSEDPHGYLHSMQSRESAWLPLQLSAIVVGLPPLQGGHTTSKIARVRKGVNWGTPLHL